MSALHRSVVRWHLAALLAMVGGASLAWAEEPVAAGESAAAKPVPFSGPLCERPYLGGDWLGTRSAMRDCGIGWNIYSTNFGMGVATGGLETNFAYRGRTDAILQIDGEKAGLWKGLTFEMHGESAYGVDANDFPGTLIPASLAQSAPSGDRSVVGVSSFKFTQALSEQLLVFAGKINTCDGFNQPFTGGADGVNGFQNAALMFPSVWSRTIPYSTFGAGFGVLNKDKEVVLSLTIFDTNNTPTVLGFNTLFNNGMVAYLSTNLPTKFFGQAGHHGLAAVYSTGSYEDLTPTPYLDPLPGIVPDAFRKGSWAVAYSFDQALYTAPDNPKQSWGIFGNLGLADRNPSPVNWSVNIGLGGTSPLPRRTQDTFGIGAFYIGVSNSLKQIETFPSRNERGVELYYNVAVTPWCHISPDFQVLAPVLEQANTVLFLGIRAKFDF